MYYSTWHIYTISVSDWLFITIWPCLTLMCRIQRCCTNANFVHHLHDQFFSMSVNLSVNFFKRHLTWSFITMWTFSAKIKKYIHFGFTFVKIECFELQPDRLIYLLFMTHFVILWYKLDLQQWLVTERIRVSNCFTCLSNRSGFESLNRELFV